MTDRRIKILGAGVAGLSCALALSRFAKCRHIDVSERETAESLPRKPGHGLLLMQNGVKSLEALGLHGFFETISPIRRAVFRDAGGIPIRVDELDDVYCVTRSALIDTLKTALPANALHLDRRVTQVIVSPGSSSEERRVNKLVFSSGDVDTLTDQDFIVDATGIGSPLFKALYPGVQRPPSRVMEIVTSTLLPDLARQLEGTFIKTQFSELGLAFGLLAPTGSRVIGFLQFDSERYQAPTSQAQIADFLQGLLQDAPEPIPTYLSAVDLSSAHVWRPANADMPDAVHCQNALMIGDAAHPLLPFTSQGVSAALEDSLLFANLLDRSSPDAPLEDELRHFSVDRRQAMREFIDGGRRILHSFIDPSHGFTLPYIEGAESQLEQDLSLPPGTLRQLIHVLDHNADGFLDWREFDLALKLFGVELGAEQTTELFVALDEDFNGMISYDEFIMAVSGGKDTNLAALLELREQLASSRELSLLTTRGRLANVFRQLDLDGNGVLDYNEFCVATASLGILYTPDESRQVFRTLDGNSDDNISFEEMLDAVERQQNEQTRKLAQRLKQRSGLVDDIDPRFSDDKVNLQTLRDRAFNFRWATLPEDVIPLTAADSDFPMAEEISDAMQDYVRTGYLPYGPPGGLPVFRDAVAQYYRAKFHVNALGDQVLATDSAASAMYLVAQQILSVGEEALIADPVDFLFERSVASAGGVVRRFRLDSSADFAFDPKEVESLINDKTRLLSICNPHNPSGRVWRRDELEQLCDIALRHGLTIMSDEVWADIVYDGAELCSVASISPEVARQTYTVYGFSKGYGLAGLRAGVLICPDSAAAEAVLTRSHADETAYGVSTLSQIAGVAAMEQAQEWLSGFVGHLQRQRDYAVARLNRFGTISCHSPEGTFVLFPRLAHFQGDATALTEQLTETHRIAVVPGSPRFFGPGAAGHIRLSIATSRAILSEGLDRLERGLAEIDGV